MCEEGVPLEVQIRTESMDHIAQEGIAAHWRYKEGEMSQDQKLEENLRWLRQMYEWLQESHNPQDFLEGVRREVQMTEIFVFTPRSEIKELPSGSTPLDFAYSVHSDIGDHCIGARVNGRIVQLNHNLRTGDMVEILTSKNQTPHVDWLDVAVTTRARAKIRQRLREMGELEPAADACKAKTPQARPAAPPKPQVRMVDDATRVKLIRIEGKKDVQVQFAKCCNPMPGHDIVGYATRRPGISIHKADCRTFARTSHNPKQVVDAAWASDNQIRAAITVTTRPRSSILADITAVIAPLNITIHEAQFRPDEDGGRYFDIVFDAPNRSAVERVTRILRTVGGVTDVATKYVQDMPRTSRV
jgi:GTP pyrophosphokinase